MVGGESVLVTKVQVLNFLQNKMDESPKGSGRYYAWGSLYILVSKDVITVTDIEARFPELA